VQGTPAEIGAGGEAIAPPSDHGKNEIKEDETPGTRLARPGVASGTDRVVMPNAISGTPNPAAALMLEKRNTPAAKTAARITAPWTQVRRVLNAEGSDEAKAFGEEADQMIADLRNMRRTPEDYDFAEIETRMAELTTRIRSSDVANDEVERMLVLVEERMSDYHSLVSAEGGDAG